MRWGSLAALPFALTEPLFINRYWSPPTLFDLARRTRFDLESVVFCAGIGALGAVVYDLATGRTPEPPTRCAADERRRAYHEGALGVPACVFVCLLLWTGAPLVAGVVSFFLIALGRIAVLPALARKTCVGGAAFAIAYALVLLAVRVSEPAYIARVWNASVWQHGAVLGLPVTELVFGLAFGLAWSGLYEQLHWTLSRPMQVTVER